jgi:beta-glucanase (GH16 family)
MAPRVRRLAVRLALGVVAAGTLTALAVALPPARSSRLGEWRRVFFDDFSHGLKPSWWGRYSGQPGGDPGGWWAPSHVKVENGILNLETYRDPRLGGHWISGGLSSARALRQTYGRYEIRLRMDRGKGVAVVALLWPSQGNWPPEIDFVENGGETSDRHHITATLHHGADNSQIQRTLRADFTRWHVLGVQWTPGRLAYTIDGRVWATVRNHAVPDQPMELDIQTQAGTCESRFAPCPDATTPPVVDAQVDWVAAYAYRASDGR